MKRIAVIATTLIAALLIMPAAAGAITTVNRGTVDVIDYAVHPNTDFVMANNSKKSQTPTYKIGTSAGMKQKGYETKKNVIKPKSKSSNAIGYKFKTELFLPIMLKKSGTYSAQNLIIVDNYFYVCYVNEKNNNKGFLARYDYKKLKALGVTDNGGIEMLRKAFDDKLKKRPLTGLEKKIIKAVKIGPEFTVGHGQTLAYNYKDKCIWMAMDLRDKNGKIIANDTTTIQRFNMKKMKPDYQIKFKMVTWTGSKYQTPFSMTFDEAGNCYFIRDFKKYYGLFVMKINGMKTTVRYVQNFKYGPSKINHIQSMSYNPYRNTVNIITNGGMMSFPSAKVGKLKGSDFSYVQFKTNREFEAIAYDKKGYGYLLVSKGPEILKSTNR